MAASKSSRFCQYAPSLYYPENLEFFGKSTPQNTFFTEQLPVAAFKCQLFFLKREKQKQFFILPLTLIRLKSCNCIKIKILLIHDSEKLLESVFQFFQYKVRQNTLCLLFTFMFIFYFKFLQTTLITKELIKHENKFNRKVFHDRENPQNRFSEFLYFMKGLKKYMGRIHCEIFLSEYFMKY